MMTNCLNRWYGKFIGAALGVFFIASALILSADVQTAKADPTGGIDPGCKANQKALCESNPANASQIAQSSATGQCYCCNESDLMCSGAGTDSPMGGTAPTTPTGVTPDSSGNLDGTSR